MAKITTTNYRKAEKGRTINSETTKYRDGSSRTIKSHPGPFGRKIISSTKRDGKK